MSWMSTELTRRVILVHLASTTTRPVDLLSSVTPVRAVLQIYISFGKIMRARNLALSPNWSSLSLYVAGKRPKPLLHLPRSVSVYETFKTALSVFLSLGIFKVKSIPSDNSYSMLRMSLSSPNNFIAGLMMAWEFLVLPKSKARTRDGPSFRDVGWFR